jgi:hypothetical protein
LQDLQIPRTVVGYWMPMSTERSFSNSTVCANSKYVVVNCLNGLERQESTLFVYDLEAVRNCNNNNEILPLCHVPSKPKTYAMFMDETHITQVGFKSEIDGLGLADIDFSP